jgi:hypothetical protein
MKEAFFQMKQTGTFVPAPPVRVPLVDRDGMVTRPWFAHFTARHEQAGGSSDKIDAAHAAAVAAVPRTTQVVASGGLHVGGALSDNVGVAFYRAVTVVGSLPGAGNADGDWAYALDGRKPGEGAGAGTGVPCFWSAMHWVAVTSGIGVTA